MPDEVHLVHMLQIFVDPSLGFALGCKWFNWVVTVAADITIAAQVIQYWTPLQGIPAWAWSALFYVFLV